MKAFLSLTFVFLFGLTSFTPTQNNPLVQQFAATALKTEALKYSATQDEFRKDKNKLPVISETLLKKYLTPALMERTMINGGDETTTHHAGKRFALDNFRTGCILYTKEMIWYKTSMLVYDNRKKKFSDVVDIAHYYAGDAGSESIAAWLYKSQSGVYMFSKNINMNYIGDNDEEVIETSTENNTLFRWDASSGKFSKEIMKDSVRTCAKFKDE